MENGIEYGMKMPVLAGPIHYSNANIAIWVWKKEGGGGDKNDTRGENAHPPPPPPPPQYSPVRRKTLGANPHIVVFSQGPRSRMVYKDLRMKF